MPEHKHDCETCPARHACCLPPAFSIARYIDGADVATDPQLNAIGLFDPARRFDLLSLEGHIEEVDTDDGLLIAFADYDLGPAIAILYPKVGGKPRLIDYNALGVPPRTNPEDEPRTSYFGDERPDHERNAILFSLAVDHPDFNRAIVLVQCHRNGLLLNDEYVFALVGWQGWPEPLEENIETQFDTIMDRLFGPPPAE